MISGRDVNFNDETHVLSINGKKHAVGDPGEIDALSALIGDISDTGLTSDTVAGQISELVSGKPDKFVSSTNDATQTIDIGTAGTNRMFLLSVGYSTEYGGHYVFGLILINSSAGIKYVSLVDGSITVSPTYANGILTLTFSEAPYSNAVLIRLS